MFFKNYFLNNFDATILPRHNSCESNLCSSFDIQDKFPTLDSYGTWPALFVWSGDEIAYKQGIVTAMIGMIKLGWRKGIGDAEAQDGDQNRIHLKLGNA